MRFYTFLMGLSLLLSSQLLSAANFYAAPGASGSGSSYDDPGNFATARGSLDMYDTIYMKGGQYDFTEKVTISKSGSATKNKVIASYPGERAILDFRNEPYGERGISISTDVQYVHLLNLTIRYTGKNAIICYGSNCRIEGIDTYGNGDTGIQMKTGGGNYILNCDSHDNFDYKSSGPNYGGNADGFADKQYAATGVNIYENCRAWNNSDDGWDFFQRSGAKTIMKNCIAYQNGAASYDMTTNPRATGVDKSFFDGLIGTSQTVTRDKKTTFSGTISLDKFPNYGNGNGFKIGGDRTNNDIELYHCLSVGNFARGFDQNNNAGPMVVYNGSAYLNGCNYGFSEISGSSLTIKNCLSLNSMSSDYFKCPTVVSSNNSWNTSGISCSSADFLSTDTVGLMTTRLPDGSIPVTSFFRLTESSDLIDRGVEVGLPYSGTAPDLGCYEFGNIDNYPPGLSVSTNSSQSIKQGNSITPITFSWSGGATGVSLTEALPEGITSSLNETEKTLTLTGTPTATGSFTVTVTTVGGSGTPISKSANIIVKDASSIDIAYVTSDGNDPADAPILNNLNNNPSFNVEVVNVVAGEASKDYSAYDLIIISPVPGSNAVGMANLEQYAGQKPMLLLKPWNMKISDATWSWATAVNTSDAAVSLTDAGTSHEIFTGFSSPLTLFSSVGKNAVTGITHSSWSSSVIAADDILVLAHPSSNENTDAIFEIPVGTTLNGTTTTARFLNIGISEASTANLTAEALSLITNACTYLLDNSTPVSETDGDADALTFENGHIRSSADNVQYITIYTLTGNQCLLSHQNEVRIDFLPSGNYIAVASLSTGQQISLKFAK